MASGVLVEVGVDVGLGFGVAVSVYVGLGVLVGLAVHVGLGVVVGVGIIGVDVGVCVDVTVCVDIDVTVEVEVKIGALDSVAVGVALGNTATDVTTGSLPQAASNRMPNQTASNFVTLELCILLLLFPQIPS